MKLKDILKDAIVTEGGTYTVELMENGKLDYQPLDYTYGLLVSQPKGIENLPWVYPTVIEDFVKARVLPTKKFLGLWMDEHGLWSVDSTEWVSNLDEAIALGNKNNQRAIYALGINRVITL